MGRENEMNMEEWQAAGVQATNQVSDETPHSNVDKFWRERVPVKSQKLSRRTKKFYLLIFFLLVLFLGGSVYGVVEYLTYQGMYHRDAALAKVGLQHLQKGTALLIALPKNPLDTVGVNRAQKEFSLASMTLVSLNNDLKSLPSFGPSIPIYGNRLAAAQHLVPLAISLATAGVTSCALLNILISRFHDPLNMRVQGFTQADIIQIGSDFLQIKSAIDVVGNEVSRLQPADVQSDPHIEQLLSKLHKDMPVFKSVIAGAEQFLAFAPALLGIGKPANYLIEILDSTELRPGGGFIGNYGIATLSGGRLSSSHLTDTYLLDQPFEATGKSIPYPSAYKWFPLATSSWSFRDSNLDADFPTAARYAEQNYKLEGGTVSVQGVVAITPAFIQQALVITGPIRIPEYGEVVTAQNLIDRIHYHQLGGSVAGEGSSLIPSPDGNSSQRKHFIALLAEHFLARLQHLSPSTFPKFLQLIANSLHSKDIQIYLNANSAENFLAQYHLNGAIQQSTDDSLMVVDANVSPNKANSMITNTLNDRMILDENGNVTHHVTLTYAWTAKGHIYGSRLYKDYVRVYVPIGSSLLTQKGWQFLGKSVAFDHVVWAGWFTLPYGQTSSITLTWMMPSAIKNSENVKHYLYTVQKQAGIQWMLRLQIVLPSCAVSIHSEEGKLSLAKQMATLTQPLYENLNLDVNYICK